MKNMSLLVLDDILQYTDNLFSNSKSFGYEKKITVLDVTGHN